MSYVLHLHPEDFAAFRARGNTLNEWELPADLSWEDALHLQVRPDATCPRGHLGWRKETGK